MAFIFKGIFVVLHEISSVNVRKFKLVLVISLFVTYSTLKSNLLSAHHVQMQ